MLWISSAISLLSLISSPIEDVRKTFAHKNSFKVSFTQKVKEDFFPDQNNSATGTIRFKRPNQLEWKYEKPTQKIIRYEKGALSVEQNGEIDRLEGTDKLGVEESFSFLWGEVSPKTLKIQNRTNSTFRVIPVKAQKAAFQWIDVEVKSGKVASARIKNKLEGESMITFQNWEFQ